MSEEKQERLIHKEHKTMIESEEKGLERRDAVVGGMVVVKNLEKNLKMGICV